MTIDENELRYDRHKRKSKRRRKGSKKKKSGKKRARIQVGGGKSDCPFCTIFWNETKYGELKKACDKLGNNSTGETCNANIQKIKDIYETITKQESLDNNKCKICGLDNNETDSKFGKVKVAEQFKIIARALTNEIAYKGISSFTDLTAKLKEAPLVEPKSKGRRFFSNPFKKKSTQKQVPVESGGGAAAAPALPATSPPTPPPAASATATGGAAPPKTPAPASTVPASTVPAPTPVVVATAKPPSPTPSTASTASANAASASAAGPAFDKDAKIQEHVELIAAQKKTIMDQTTTITQQRGELTENDTKIDTQNNTIERGEEALSRLVVKNNREIENLKEEHRTEVNKIKSEQDALVEEKTTAKIEEMFKPIGDSTVFYVKINGENAVDKLGTIIAKLQKLISVSEGEQRGERSRHKFGASGSAESLSDDVVIQEAQQEAILEEAQLEAQQEAQLKKKVKQKLLQPGSVGDGDIGPVSPSPSPTHLEGSSIAQKLRETRQSADGH